MDLNGFLDGLNWAIGVLVYGFTQFLSLFNTPLGKEYLIILSAFFLHLMIFNFFPKNPWWLAAEIPLLIVTILYLQRDHTNLVARQSPREGNIFSSCTIFLTYAVLLLNKFPVTWFKKSTQKPAGGSPGGKP